MHVYSAKMAFLSNIVKSMTGQNETERKQKLLNDAINNAPFIDPDFIAGLTDSPGSITYENAVLKYAKGVENKKYDAKTRKKIESFFRKQSFEMAEEYADGNKSFVKKQLFDRMKELKKSEMTPLAIKVLGDNLDRVLDERADKELLKDIGRTIKVDAEKIKNDEREAIRTKALVEAQRHLPMSQVRSAEPEEQKQIEAPKRAALPPAKYNFEPMVGKDRIQKLKDNVKNAKTNAPPDQANPAPQQFEPQDTSLPPDVNIRNVKKTKEHLMEYYNNMSGNHLKYLTENNHVEPEALTDVKAAMRSKLIQEAKEEEDRRMEDAIRNPIADENGQSFRDAQLGIKPTRKRLNAMEKQVFETGFGERFDGGLDNISNNPLERNIHAAEAYTLHGTASLETLVNRTGRQDAIAWKQIHGLGVGQTKHAMHDLYDIGVYNIDNAAHKMTAGQINPSLRQSNKYDGIGNNDWIKSLFRR